ncbi:hypothetical protein D3C72_2133060 [compost metagenome]
MTCCHASTGIFSIMAVRVMPALFTNPSTLPKRATARSTTDGAKSGSETSPATVSRRSPAARWNSASASAFMSTAVTRAPNCSASSLIARPMPWAAPVMMTLRWSSR